jgi:hypothetical protein
VGVGFRIGDLFGIYYPLAESQNIRDGYIGDGFADKLRFTINLNPVNTGLIKKLIK